MRVLIAEDDPIARRLLEITIAGWGYEVVSTSNGAQALAALQGPNHPQLAILDWMMPEMDGVSVCRALRAERAERYVYVLLLTANGDKRAAVDAIEAGADDFLTKPFNPSEVRARIGTGRRIVELQRELVQAREKLRDQATHDGLTGLHNRGSVREFLDRELKRSEDTSIAVIMIDVNRFKQVNDTLGHLAGDVVLRNVAEHLKGLVGPRGTVGRYGGDEFLLVVPNCDDALSSDLVGRIRENSPELSRGLPSSWEVTISVGLAIIKSASGVTVDQAVEAADRSMYGAKRSRNQLTVAGR